MYVLTSISALLFFGFVILGVVRYGLLSCYSEYASEWQKFYPKLNIWSMVTAITALLMVPVLIESGAGNPWQFLGFLAPVSLIAVAASPEYAKDKFQWWIHQIGAWSAVAFIVLYSIKIPNLWWIVLILAAVAAGLGIWKKGTWMFWGEMAMYLATYVILYVII